MTISKQFKTIKENWLVALIGVIIVAVLVLTPLFFLGIAGSTSYSTKSMANSMAYDMVESAAAGRSYGGTYYGDDGFAPEVSERKITKNAHLSTEVKKGSFSEAETNIQAIIDASDAYLLNENVNTYEVGHNEYKNGYYSIKVNVENYDSFIAQLEAIGEVKSFSESANDITGTYTSIETELKAAKDRLARYQKLLLDEEATSEDKITITDRIYDQERTIAYYEDQLKNQDNKIAYSTISVTLSEKRSDFADVAIVTFADLIKSIVASFNALLKLIFVVIPWIIAIGIITIIVKVFRRKK